MNSHQRTAIEHHCRLAIETMHPRFAWALPKLGVSVILSVNSGYEWIEAGFGGPVWHASVAPLGSNLIQRTVLRRMARAVLKDVGDRRLGEWEEYHAAFHLRRRLSRFEDPLVGPVCDIRGTDEARRRADALGDMIQHAPPGLLAEELGPV